MSDRPIAGRPLMGPGGLIWFRFEAASGQPAAEGLLLSLRAEVTPAAEMGSAVCDFRAGVTAQFATGWLSLGRASAAGPVHVPPSGDAFRPRTLDLQLSLGREALARVEEMRGEAALDLLVELYGWLTTSGGETIAGVTQERWPVSAAEWSQALDQAQTYQGMTLLVRRPDSETSEQLRSADRHLSDARRALREGRYREAVTAVRRGVEVLELHGKPTRSPARPVQEVPVEERYGRLGRALFDLAGASVHEDGVNVGYIWTHSDAVAAVATLMALMRRMQSRSA